MPNQGSADGSVELKAGHPPAVKVGNMRVTQRTHSTSSDRGDQEHQHEQGERKSSTSGDGHGSGVVPSACSFAPKTEVNKATGGVPDSLANHSNVEAIKHIHDKPQATHELRNPASRPNMIQQPKK